MKITTVHVLGIITLCEIFYLNNLDASVVLWIAYGIYKFLKD